MKIQRKQTGKDHHKSRDFYQGLPLRGALFSSTLVAAMNLNHVEARSMPSLPPEVAQHLSLTTASTENLQGHGNLVVFFMNIYKGTLWVQTKNSNPGRDLQWLFSQPFSLSITYNRDIEKQKLVDVSLEELKRYFPEKSTSEQTYRSQLSAIFTQDIRETDRISALFDPKSGLQFTLNGQNIGSISDINFAKEYIQIWLHPNAKYQRFRGKLLGLF